MTTANETAMTIKLITIPRCGCGRQHKTFAKLAQHRGSTPRDNWSAWQSVPVEGDGPWAVYPCNRQFIELHGTKSQALAAKASLEAQCSCGGHTVIDLSDAA